MRPIWKLWNNFYWGLVDANKMDPVTENILGSALADRWRKSLEAVEGISKAFRVTFGKVNGHDSLIYKYPIQQKSQCHVSHSGLSVQNK